MSVNQYIKPAAAERKEGELYIGGCSAVELAEKYGTPLYVIDEASLRGIGFSLSYQTSKQYFISPLTTSLQKKRTNRPAIIAKTMMVLFLYLEISTFILFCLLLVSFCPFLDNKPRPSFYFKVYLSDIFSKYAYR